MSETPTPYSKIKIGEAFRLEQGGPIWVKAKGGFRQGLGGQLHSCQPNVLVYKYNPSKIV